MKISRVRTMLIAVAFAILLFGVASYFEALQYGLFANATERGADDVCPNIDGVQTQLPGGMEKKNGDCVQTPSCVTDGIGHEVEGGMATLIIPPNGCSVKVSFSSYSHNGTVRPFEDQVLIDNITDTYGPGTYHIGPLTLACNWQTDLYIGDVLEHLGPNGHNDSRYLLDYDAVEDQVCTVCVSPGFKNAAVDLQGEVGTPLSYTIELATGTPTVVISATGLPQGITLLNNTISGTPTQAGIFTVILRGENTCGHCQSIITLVVVERPAQCPTPAPVITSGNTALGTVGSAFGYTLTTTGTVNSLSVTNLPSGLSFNAQTGVISGVPAQAGTFTATLRAANACASHEKTLTIIVGGGGGSCPLTAPTFVGELSVSVTANQSFSYTIQTSGTVTSLDVTNVPSWLNFSTTSKVLFGTPTASGEFRVTLKAANECALTERVLVITVIAPPSVCTSCGGGGGGGGGFFTPTVVLTRATTSSPLASFASVYLSQVPYTGLEDILVTIGYILGLLGVSGAAAFFILKRKKTTATTPEVHEQYTDAYIAQAIAGTPLNLKETLMSGSAPTISPPHSEVKTFYSENISDFISQGLSTVKNTIAHRAISTMVGTVGASEDVLIDTLTRVSLEQGVLIDKDGATLIVAASDGKEESALRILNQMIGVAKEWYPSSQNIALDTVKIRSIFFSTYISMIPLFIHWVAVNDSKKVFNFIKMLNAQGHPTADFLKNVAFELDRVYRFRTESEKGADEYAIQATLNWKKETLERVVSILIGAFDESYTSGFTASKLALSKVFDVLSREKGNQIPTINLKELA